MTSAQQTLDSKSAIVIHSAKYCSPACQLPIVLYDISQLLNTQLDKETLATCVSMIESGVNPEALAVRANSLSLPHALLTRSLFVGGCAGAQARGHGVECAE